MNNEQIRVLRKERGFYEETSDKVTGAGMIRNWFGSKFRLIEFQANGAGQFIGKSYSGIQIVKRPLVDVLCFLIAK